MEKENNLKVCKKCLMAIIAHEGNQATIERHADEDDEQSTVCEWCGESGFTVLYEFI